MSATTTKHVAEELEELKSSLQAILARIGQLESTLPAEDRPAAATAAAPAAAPVPVEEEISEELMIAIGAAVAAFLGERAHIRAVRLAGSGAWAQQGRVFIQASHRINVPHHQHR